ncbi:MAG: hypothetical protein EON58_02020 [Alphaproteobacteria bacterium]|nr:MAG: hypothetical protein EON58_02020 [Alphaproteobacteria bacterium]
MPLLHRPHTLVLDLVPNDPEDLDVYAPREASIKGQLTPETMNSAVERFQIEVNRPHLFLADPGDLDLFQLERRVTMGAQVFVVASPVKKFRDGGPASHDSVLLSEVDD